MTTVSAALIVRDEAKFLPGCLDSLHEKVDDIIVVDTGSRDFTKDIAERAGAKVFRFEWIDDFAAARNFGLEKITTDWVLYIDADERIGTPGGKPICNFIDPAAIAASVRFRPKTGYTRYQEFRLFRRDSRLRFSGNIHETMLPVIEEISRREGSPLGDTPVTIDHLGYDGDQSSKYARNIPLLRRYLLADPARVYCWYHLAESLHATGQCIEAIGVAHEGLAAARLYPSEKQRANASLIFQMLARISLESDGDALSLIDLGLEYVPEDYALLLMRARALINAGDFEQALGLAKGLTTLDPDNLPHSLLAFDRRVFGEYAHDLAAIASFKLGRFSEASYHFASAASLSPDKLAYRIKAKAAELRNNSPSPCGPLA